MNLPRLDLAMTIGATFEAPIGWEDENETLVPLPSGTEVEVEARTTRSASAVVLRFRSASPAADEGSISIVDPGYITLRMTPAQTAVQTPQILMFDIKYTFPTGQVFILPEGVPAYLTISLPHTRS